MFFLNDLSDMGIEAQLISNSCMALVGGELPLYAYAKNSMFEPKSYGFLDAAAW